MTNSPNSSDKPEDLNLELAEVHGKCAKHGPWVRTELKILAHQYSERCPECEKPVQPLRFDQVELTGSCATHGDWSRMVPKILAGKMTDRCPECQAIADEQRKLSEQSASRNAAESKKVRMIRKLFGESGIPRRFHERTFENYTPATEEQSKALAKSKAFAENFPKAVELGASLLFCGKPGTGKTHLACAIGNYIMQVNGASVLFVTVFDAIQRVKDTYGGKDKSEREVMQGFAAPDLLILDEVGVQFGTEFEKVIITDIINRRYSDMRPTIIMSNLNEEELGQYLGERVVDRMCEGGGGVLAFTWESYRANVAKDRSLPRGKYTPPDWMQPE